MSSIDRGSHTDETEQVGSGSKKRRLLSVGLIAASLIALALASAIRLGDKARTISDELNAANALVSTLRDNILDGDTAAATQNVAELKKHTGKARQAATDPLWTMAGAIPVVGANFEAAAEIAASADDLARLGAAPLVSVAKAVDWKALKLTEQGLPLAHLASAQPNLQEAAHAVRESSDRLNAISADRLMPQIASPLVHARRELTALRASVDSAADVAEILPPMMGTDSPRSYLLLIQNNAELRATGGIPGALAVLQVDKGKLSLGTQSSASALGTFDPRVTVDQEQQQIFSTRMGKFMQDVNLTPDFPTAAHTALAMWKAKTGEQLDGVLSIDPIALSYILDATGPVQLNDALILKVAGQGLPTELTAKNVVRTLLSDVYSKIEEPALQDLYFAGVAQEVFSKLSSGAGDTKKLVDGITRGAAERRILLSSSRADEQALIARYPLGGAISGASISPAQFGVYFNDGTGAKMDYYVKRTVQLITKCPANGYSEVKVRITSTNTAPLDAATSLPSYVTGGGVFGVPAGSVQTNVTAYGPVQSNVETAYVTGKKTGFASYRHSNRPVGALTIRLAPGESRTVEFIFGKIVQHAAPQLSVTPTIQSQNEVVLPPLAAACAPAE